MAEVTAILLNYKRPTNVRRIIPALRAQTVDLHIVLVDNSVGYVALDADQKPDELWKPPRNIGPFARYLAAYAYDGWLYFQDDDVVPKDGEFVADLLALAQERPAAITGAYGRNIPPSPPHYRHRDTYGQTNMVKAICCMMHRSTLGQARFPAGDVGRNDDIWISLETSGGKPIHWSERSFIQRLRLLPQMNAGLSHNPQHYPEREAFSAAWWKEHDG